MNHYEAGREMCVPFTNSTLRGQEPKQQFSHSQKRFLLLLTLHSKAADNYRLHRHNAFTGGTTPLP